MPAVGDSDRFGCAGPGGLGVGAAAFEADHRGSGTRSQPCGHGLGAPVGQDIDRAVGVHVHQDGAVAMPFTQGEVVDPEYLDGVHRRIRQAAYQPQQGRTPYWHPQSVRQACSGSSSQRQPDPLENRGQQWGVPSIRRGQPIDLFGECPSAAPLVRAQESAHPKNQAAGPVTDRGVGEGAVVAAVDPAAPCSRSPGTRPSCVTAHARIRIPAADASIDSMVTPARCGSRTRRSQRFAEHRQDHRLRIGRAPEGTPLHHHGKGARTSFHVPSTARSSINATSISSRRSGQRRRRPIP